MMARRYSILIFIPFIFMFCWITLMIIISYDQNLVFNASIINMMSSAILAFLTLIYVLQNQTMLKEMAIARKSDFFPHINFSFKHLDDKVLWLYLENTGKGPAINVKLRYGFGGSLRNWAHPLISSGEHYTFLWHSPKLKENFIVNGTCEDVFGDEFTISEIMDLKEVYNKMSENVMIREPSLEEVIKDVCAGVENISRELADLKRIQEKKNIPAYLKIDNLEIKQPPLKYVLMHLGGIMFSGESFNNSTNEKLEKFEKDDVVEIYCNDRQGVIYVGVTIIKKILLEKNTINEKDIHSFNIEIEYIKK